MSLLLIAALLQADPGRVEQLVRDLGSETYSVRQKADEELRKLGAAAAPALKEAVADADPERARRARAILAEIEKKPSRPADPRPKPEAAYRSLKLSVGADGRVEAVVVESDAVGKTVEKTYTAGSMEEFRRRHPDLARHFGLGAEKMDDVGKGLRDWMKRFEDGDFAGRDLFKDLRESPFFRDLLKDVPEPFADLLDNPEEFMERFRELQPGLDPGGPPAAPRLPRPEGQFGVALAPVGEALSSHLGLPLGEGALVVEVTKDSRAARAGIREMDVVLAVDGQPIKDAASARQAIREKLDGWFTLEVMRAGKRETLKVEPKSAK